MKIGVQAFSDVTSNSYCRNRHLNAIEHHATTPATIAFDCSDYLGGNFWSNHNGIGPFEGVIYTPAGNTGGPYVDRYPFPSDNVGKRRPSRRCSSLSPAALSPLDLKRRSSGCRADAPM